jgi:hypothetical protein
LKSHIAVIYCDCFQAFVEGENFFGRDTGKFIFCRPNVENIANESLSKAYAMQTLNLDLLPYDCSSVGYWFSKFIFALQ